MASNRSKRVDKKAEIQRTEAQLQTETRDINAIVGKCFIEGGMVAQGRHKALEMLQRVDCYIEHYKTVMLKNQRDTQKVTEDRNSANAFLMKFELYKDDIEKYVKGYKAD